MASACGVSGWFFLGRFSNVVDGWIFRRAGGRAGRRD
jgi:hypothetical protein